MQLHPFTLQGGFLSRSRPRNTVDARVLRSVAMLTARTARTAPRIDANNEADLRWNLGGRRACATCRSGLFETEVVSWKCGRARSRRESLGG
jgi:hypothetical protein